MKGWASSTARCARELRWSPRATRPQRVFPAMPKRWLALCPRRRCRQTTHGPSGINDAQIVETVYDMRADAYAVAALLYQVPAADKAEAIEQPAKILRRHARAAVERAVEACGAERCRRSGPAETQSDRADPRRARLGQERLVPNSHRRTGAASGRRPSAIVAAASRDRHGSAGHRACLGRRTGSGRIPRRCRRRRSPTAGSGSLRSRSSA